MSEWLSQLAPYAIPAVLALYGTFVLLRGRLRPSRLTFSVKRVEGVPARLIGAVLIAPLPLTLFLWEELAGWFGMHSPVEREKVLGSLSNLHAENLRVMNRSISTLEDTLAKTDRLLEQARTMQGESAALRKLAARSGLPAPEVPAEATWEEVLTQIRSTAEKTRETLANRKQEQRRMDSSYRARKQEVEAAWEAGDRQTILTIGNMLAIAAMLVAGMIALLAGKPAARPAANTPHASPG